MERTEMFEQGKKYSYKIIVENESSLNLTVICNENNVVITMPIADESIMKEKFSELSSQKEFEQTIEKIKKLEIDHENNNSILQKILPFVKSYIQNGFLDRYIDKSFAKK